MYNGKGKTIKLLEDKIEESLYDFGYDNNFLDATPKAQSLKERINKLNCIKILRSFALWKTPSRK